MLQEGKSKEERREGVETEGKRGGRQRGEEERKKEAGGIGWIRD